LFVLTRHGESTANVAGIASANPDHEAPLTRRGIAQARRLREQLKEMPFDTVVCSELLRARQTAEIVTAGHGAEVRTDERLDELRFGILDGLRISAIHDWERAHGGDAPFPGGESRDEAARRYGHALKDLLRKPLTCTLVVTHALLVESVAAALDLGGWRKIPYATPYLFDGDRLMLAVARLESGDPLRQR
jgi:broad specificity phosphatase PhoE